MNHAIRSGVNHVNHIHRTLFDRMCKNGYVTRKEIIGVATIIVTVILAFSGWAWQSHSNQPHNNSLRTDEFQRLWNERTTAINARLDRIENRQDQMIDKVDSMIDRLKRAEH